MELTTTPGLGHLRRALLDERNFKWQTTEATPVAEQWSNSETNDTAKPGRTTKPDESETADAQPAGDNATADAAAERKKHGPRSVQLRLTDPTANRVGTIEIDLDLDGGWVGPSGESKRVQTTDYVRPKLRNYFKTVVNFQEKRYDDRP